MAIVIDGSRGEGGGQILRTSVALGALSNTAVVIDKVRAGRKKPGLRQQHLTAVTAAARVCNGRLKGDRLGSTRLELHPQQVRGGRFRFDIKTAGSTGLVLQTVLPPLLLAEESSDVTIVGGTHNPWAPPFDFLANAFAPLLTRMGAHLKIDMLRPGFYPAGGGELRVRIDPSPHLRPLELHERGEVQSRRVRVLLARLPRHIAEREVAGLEAALGWPASCFEIDERRDSRGPGNAIVAEIACENVTEVFCACGRKGLPVAEVIAPLADEITNYLDCTAPVGAHLADQLLVPLAMGGGGSFTTVPVSEHFTTNAAVIAELLPITVTAHEREDGCVVVEVERTD